jgi:hypothetical protein
MTTKKNRRNVYNVSKNGSYRREHRIAGMGMGLRRGDTRHGGKSSLVIWERDFPAGENKVFVMSLAEARSLYAFLERELRTLAR